MTALERRGALTRAFSSVPRIEPPVTKVEPPAGSVLVRGQIADELRLDMRADRLHRLIIGSPASKVNHHNGGLEQDGLSSRGQQAYPSTHGRWCWRHDRLFEMVTLPESFSSNGLAYRPRCAAVVAAITGLLGN